MGEEEGDVWKRVAMRLHLEELGGKVCVVEADMHEVYCEEAFGRLLRSLRSIVYDTMQGPLQSRRIRRIKDS